MTTKHTPSPADPATLTEQELFARFLISRFTHQSKKRWAIEVAPEDDLIAVPDGPLRDWAFEALDELRAANDPTEALDDTISELESVAKLWRQNADSFSAFKLEHIIRDDDDAPATYRMPTIPTTDDAEFIEDGSTPTLGASA